MSSRSSIVHAIRMARTRQAITGRGFAFSTTSRLGLKESSNHVDYDKHKKDSLDKQRKGSGHWKPELASDSEEAVRADREGRGPAVDPKVLQERTKRAAEETSKAGTSMRDGF
ncbi:hypothetical protein PT974_10142 [Cladobotryum mycophilum]|uniref:Mitochondrial carrier protein PET8 n=1 Tax=Cladobotryum mycophilum TaxID=491253 RepID=A0ABR0SAH4_9HYPO